MSALDLARRLFLTSALLLFGGVAISVITRDEWLTIAHAVSVVAALAVLLLLAAGLRRIGRARTAGVTSDGDTSHEQGQVGLDERALRADRCDGAGEALPAPAGDAIGEAGARS